jgi:integrase
LIFQAALGGRLRRDGWNRRVWKPAVASGGRPDLGFHSLRHYYASALIHAGLSAPVVARRLGNTAQMILETYSHLWRDDDDRTREAIDNLFSGVAL